MASFVSFAQPQTKVWTVGFLVQGNRPASIESSFFGAFPRGMSELGYVEGKNLIIEWRFADDKAERLHGLAAELVQLKVDVIVASGTTSAISASQKASTSIPIVMAGAADPVGDGFVKSLASPGGNITGYSNMTGNISSKQLEILLDMVPRLSRVAVLVNPNNSVAQAGAFLKNLQIAGRKSGVTILSFEARTPPEIEHAFSQMARQKTGALIVMRDSTFNRQVGQIADLAAKHRLPAIAGLREYVEVNGLMSYGTNVAVQFHRAATYVDKIFKGAKPAELPVEQPTKFELFINGKTAKVLGLTIPQALLISADKVIE